MNAIRTESIGKKSILFIKILFLVCVIHISIISFFDIMDMSNGWKINYPIIHPYFVLGIFFSSNNWCYFFIYQKLLRKIIRLLYSCNRHNRHLFIPKTH